VSMLTAGISLPRVLVPLIGMGLLTVTASMALNYSLAPHAELARKALLSEARARPAALIEGQIFRNRTDDRTWFVQNFRHGGNSFNNVQVLQQDPNVRPLKESDAYPAMAERGYGWEKLISEMLCQEYWAERGLKTFIARFHNVYGPDGTWDGGREKAPAAVCRKVAEAVDTGVHTIEIWGDGNQSRSFMYIDDCVKGVDMIMHCDQLIATPVNLGSSELVSINGLVDMVEGIAGVKLDRKYDLTAPRGVGGRNSDNTFIQQILHWEPNTTLVAGLRETYQWIQQQYQKRKKGQLVVA